MENKSQKVFFYKYLFVIVNFLIFAFSITGFLLSCFFAQRDGYSHWLTRLLYFTQQSNLWIGITSLIFAIILVKKKKAVKSLKVISVLKYIFTVSITITGIIFCALLAPFADYNVWTFASVLTHVVVPILSILDFIMDYNIDTFEKKYTWLAIIPPLIYFVFASILCILKIDFGRGDPYPYFFMNYYSEVGLFGFAFESLPQLGSFYWFLFFFIFIFVLSISLHKIKEIVVRRQKKN